MIFWHQTIQGCHPHFNLLAIGSLDPGLTFPFFRFQFSFLFRYIDELVLHILSPVTAILLAFFKVDKDFFTSSSGEGGIRWFNFALPGATTLKAWPDCLLYLKLSSIY